MILLVLLTVMCTANVKSNYEFYTSVTLRKFSILASIILTSAILGFSIQDNTAYATIAEIGDTVFKTPITMGSKMPMILESKVNC